MVAKGDFIEIKYVIDEVKSEILCIQELKTFYMKQVKSGNKYKLLHVTVFIDCNSVGNGNDVKITQ